LHVVVVSRHRHSLFLWLRHGRLGPVVAHIRSTSVRLHALALSSTTLAGVLWLLLSNSNSALFIREKRCFETSTLEDLGIGFVKSVFSDSNIRGRLSREAQESHCKHYSFFSTSQISSDLSQDNVEVFVAL